MTDGYLAMPRAITKYHPGGFFDLTHAPGYNDQLLAKYCIKWLGYLINKK